jgi:hypothetical protein
MKVGRLIATLVGVALFLAGPIMVYKGVDGIQQVRSQLSAEKIFFGDDAKELAGAVPGAQVDTGTEAKQQAEIINYHALDATKGKTYAEMDREDPLRSVQASAASLRTSLNTAYMAEQIGYLVTGLGLAFTALGGALVALGRRE